MPSLHLAALQGDSAMVEQLLDAGSDPNQLNKVGVPPLFSVLKPSMSSTPQQMVERERIFMLLWDKTAPDIRLGQDESGATVLHLMAVHGFDRLAHLILEKEPQLSSIAKRFQNQDYPIHTAILNGQYEVAKSLFDLDVQTSFYVNALEQSPLHIAAQCGSKAMWKLCCERFIAHDIEHVDRNGHTALALLRGRFALTEEELTEYEQYIPRSGEQTNSQRT